jgi:hypothetical protein
MEQGVCKVGDWVVFKGYSDYYDGKTVQVHKITSNNFLYINVKNDDNGECHTARFATNDEIRKAGGIVPVDIYEIY